MCPSTIFFLRENFFIYFGVCSTNHFYTPLTENIAAWLRLLFYLILEQNWVSDQTNMAPRFFSIFRTTWMDFYSFPVMRWKIFQFVVSFYADIPLSGPPFVILGVLDYVITFRYLHSHVKYTFVSAWKVQLLRANRNSSEQNRFNIDLLLHTNDQHWCYNPCSRLALNTAEKHESYPTALSRHDNPEWSEKLAMQFSKLFVICYKFCTPLSG